MLLSVSLTDVFSALTTVPGKQKMLSKYVLSERMNPANGVGELDRTGLQRPIVTCSGIL